MSEINTESIGLYIPLIDDRSEEQIYQAAQNVVASRSGGQLNDFSDHNPLGVLLRAQAFAGAEILYRVNKLPLALAVKLLELTGVVRKLGQSATAQLTFSLTAPRTIPFVIPQGFQVVDASGQFSFTTEALLTIPAGASSGVVSAIAARPGSDYNLPGYTINQITQPLAFLASVTNIEPSQGGAAEESVEDAIARGLVALRRRNPVSPADFENAATDIMGSGSRAKAIGLLDGDKRPNIPGAVHVFCLAPTGEPANPAVIGNVYSSLIPEMMLGTSLYVSPMEVANIEPSIVARLQAEAVPNDVASALWDSLIEFLSPASFEPGRSLLIQELRHQLRFVPGIEYIDELTINGAYIDIPMPNEWTLPQAYSFSMTLVDAEGNFFQTMRGAGEVPDFGDPI